MRRQCLLCPYSGRSCAAAQNVAMGHEQNYLVRVMQVCFTVDN